MRLDITGVSLRETATALERIGIKRSHQAIYQWTHRVGEEAPNPSTFMRAKPSRVAINETVVQIDRGQFWLYAAIGMDSKLLLGVRVSRWQAECPASVFLTKLKGRRDLSEVEFLVEVR